MIVTVLSPLSIKPCTFASYLVHNTSYIRAVIENAMVSLLAHKRTFTLRKRLFCSLNRKLRVTDYVEVKNIWPVKMQTEANCRSN